MHKPQKKIVVLALILAAAGYAVFRLTQTQPFVYAGTAEATRIDIPARISSVISDIAVREGDRIAKGQTMLTFAGEDYRLAASLAETNFARSKKMHDDGYISDYELDQVKNKRDDAALKMAWCTVASPIDGSVLARYREPGEMVAPGAQLFTVADLRRLYAYVYVPQPRIAALSLGGRVAAHLAEMPGRIFEGRIETIADEAEFTPKNVQTQDERERLVYAVKIAFANDDFVLKPGMTLLVSFDPEKQP